MHACQGKRCVNKGRNQCAYAKSDSGPDSLSYPSHNIVQSLPNKLPPQAGRVSYQWRLLRHRRDFTTRPIVSPRGDEEWCQDSYRVILKDHLTRIAALALIHRHSTGHPVVLRSSLLLRYFKGNQSGGGKRGKAAAVAAAAASRSVIPTTIDSK